MREPVRGMCREGAVPVRSAGAGRNKLSRKPTQRRGSRSHPSCDDISSTTTASPGGSRGPSFRSCRFQHCRSRRCGQHGCRRRAADRPASRPRRCAPAAPVSYTHLDVYKRQVLNRPQDANIAAMSFAPCPVLSRCRNLHYAITLSSSNGTDGAHQSPARDLAAKGTALRLPPDSSLPGSDQGPEAVSYTHLDVYKRQGL